MSNKRALSIALFLTLVFVAGVGTLWSSHVGGHVVGPYPPPNHHVWPLSNSTTPDFPLSSTYGPRQKASEGFRYDWHRGIDIPAPCNTDVYAIADGVVRLAGDYSLYNDRVVQLCHFKPGAPAHTCGTDADADGFMDDADADGDVDNSISSDAYYSNYMHLSSVAVTVGQSVARGDIIGDSGESEIGATGVCYPDDLYPDSGFDHLHFEIRDGHIRQMNTVHPLLVLPYIDTTAPQVTINSVDVSDPTSPIVDLTVELLLDALDFNRVEVVVYDSSSGSLIEVDRHAFDMMQWNFDYTPFVGGSSDTTILDTAPAYDGVYDGDYGGGPVSPATLGVTVSPAQYNASSNSYRIDFVFDDLSGVASAADLVVKVRAVDVHGHLPAGRIAFHSYTEYDDDNVDGHHSIDGVISVVDLLTNTHYEPAEVTIDNGVQHAMNPKFSHDGSQLVFMGLPRTRMYSHTDDAWANYLDIFLYDFRTDQLTNLSAQAGMAVYGAVEEDPDFSPDGQQVIFKRDRSDLWTIDLGTFELSQVTFDGATSEESGPRYAPDGQWVVYWVGSGSDAGIYRQRVIDGLVEVVVDNPGLQDMYPASLDANRLVYSRWFSAGQRDDEIYVVDLSTFQSQAAPFNSLGQANDSDPFAVEESLVGFSSDRSSEHFRIGRNDWDLFFGNLDTGRVYWLEAASTDKHDLGGTFTAYVVAFEDRDADGVSDWLEDSAPNGGDANHDGVADGQQINVTSLPNAADGRYVTLASPDGTSLAEVRAVENPSPGDAPSGVYFPLDFFAFTVQAIAPGEATTVTLFLPPGVTIDTYYLYGPTPDNPIDHWYEFSFDGTTGAVILADRVILHFVDGQRGDSDLTANGKIEARVASAYTAPLITNGMPASHVIGWPDFVTGGDFTLPPLYGAASPSDKSEPSAVNVLGQPDFTSNGFGALNPAVGCTTAINACSFLEHAVLNLVYDSVHQRLFVTDRTRVLVFDVATITNHERAVHVLGQEDFTKSELNMPCGGGPGTGWGGTPGACGYEFPSGITFDEASQRLFVGDTNNLRVFVYDDVSPGSLTNGMAADHVLGQIDFTTKEVNMPCGGGPGTGPGGTPSACGYSGYSAPLHDPGANRLYVADSNNNRILVYDLPGAKELLVNGVRANYVLGQPDFATMGFDTQNPAFGCTTTPNACGMTYVFGMAVEPNTGRLYAADSWYHRILVYDIAAGITNGMPATRLLGKTDFTIDTDFDEPVCFGGSATQSTFCSPYGLAYDGTHDRLLVADIGNHRVLVFEFPEANAHALYVWRDPAQNRNGTPVDLPEDSDEAQKLADFAVTEGIRTIYYDNFGCGALSPPDCPAGAEQQDSSTLAPIVALLHAHGLRVEALYTDNTRLADLVAYNNAAPADARFDAVRLDIEASGGGPAPFPSGGSEPTTPEDLDLYADAVSMAGTLPVYASIGHHWGSDPEDSLIPYNGSTKKAYEHIVDIVAGIDVQTAQDGLHDNPIVIEEITKEEVCYANAVGKPVHVTIETYDAVSNLNPLPPEAPEFFDYNTFFEEGEAAMTSKLATLDYTAPGVTPPCSRPQPTGFAYHFYKQSYGSPSLPHWAPDGDGDHLVDPVDAQPATFSEAFSDVGLGGTTTGVITARGDQTFTIADATDPLDGVVITAAYYGGATPAMVSVCSGAAELSLSAGDTVVVTCSSVTIKVTRGTVEMTLVAADNTTATVSLGEGNSLLFDPTTYTITTPLTNSDPVVVLIDGEEFPLAPGETVRGVTIDIKPGSDPNSINLGSGGNVPVGILSTTTFDATTADPTTVTLASSPVKLKGKGTPMASFEDVDGDGLLDLVVHVETQALELSETDEEAILEGETFDGVRIRGVDTVRIVP
jgi:murein DD-endopeptidase MepM/ murein hydrolase activator NlpD